MINFIFPQMYKNANFNKKFFSYLSSFPNGEVTMFSERVNIFAQAGNFPYSFWHGGINTDIVDNHIVLQSEVMKYYLENNTLLMLDFSNLRLLDSPSWIDDPHAKMILSFFKNKGHLIKVASKEIKDQINDEYPGYDYVIEDFGQEYNPNDFMYISASTLSSNNLKPIKTFYPLFNKCVECSKYLQCKGTENLQQYTFCEASIRTQCQEKNNWDADFWREKIFTARSQGYRFFEFGDIPINELPHFNTMLVDLFIRPEYRDYLKWECI